MKTRKKAPGMFGKWLHRNRVGRKMTIENLALKVGTSKGYISGIETGLINPPAEKLCIRIAKLFRYSAAKAVLMSYADKAPATIRGIVTNLARKKIAGNLNGADS